MRRILLTLLAAAGLAATTAHAYEPESGIWWNPNESGTGYAIEVQDDMMAVTIYGGDQNGFAKWYTSTGRLDGNAYFEADLLGFDHVQPIGKPYPGRPVLEPGYGKLKIVFDPNDNRRATLTWPNGRSIPIQRQEFYFWRSGEDPNSISVDTTKMLGEWQITADISSFPNADYPFMADVLVLDLYERGSDGIWYYEGCRPDDAQVGGCSDYALTHFEAVGYFEAPTGLHVTVVKDGVDQYGRQYYVLYVMKMGTNDGSGELTAYMGGTNPDHQPAYPARAFRSASRTFVQEGSGPAKSVKDSPARLGLSAQLVAQGATLPAPSKTKIASRFDRTALLPVIRQLEARLQAD